MLTIALTRACNFNCVYCYEHDRKPIYMSDEVARDLIDFIKRFPALARLSITWYGGEPLLCFDRICSLTDKIKELDIAFTAMLVTNGYLLNEETSSKLTDLKIETVQVTVDGREPIHNKRRPLKSGLIKTAEEKMAIAIIQEIIRRLVGKPKKHNEV